MFHVKHSSPFAPLFGGEKMFHVKHFLISPPAGQKFSVKNLCFAVEISPICAILIFTINLTSRTATVPVESRCRFLAKIIAIVNQKGGVGKTTTCVNLTAALRERGKRVLLCDFDPQANSTSGMGVDKTVSQGVYDVLINGADAKETVVATRYGDVLSSSKALAGAGIEMIDLPDRQFRLKQALDVLSPDYDFILIDCPPSLELLTLNALCAANSLLVPVQGEYYALEGLSDLMNTVRIVRRSMNPKLELEGVLLTMFDGRTNLAMQVAEEVKRYFPGKVYATVIPRNVRLSEAPSHGKPINAYDRSSRGAEAYGAFADEFLKRSR